MTPLETLGTKKAKSTRSHVQFPTGELWDFCLQLAQASRSLVGLV